MASNDKNSLVDHECEELIGGMQSDLRSIYQDIAAQAGRKSVDNVVSYLNMTEKAKVSEYVNELLRKMRTAFSKALRQLQDEKGNRRYTDSQVTLMWQSVAANTALPELRYIDARNIPMESTNRQESLNQNASVPIIPLVGLGVGAAGLLGASAFPITATAAWTLRGASVGVGCVSIYGIYKKKFGNTHSEQTQTRADSDMITKITDAQYTANAEILKKWIYGVGKEVEEGEPIL